ncbi:MAG: LLM class flavin-dependent oxidoreductase, partial [Acidimicrobiales bacterium]
MRLVRWLMAANVVHASNIDVISGGRLDWGIGAGWYDHEYKAYGYDFPKPADRIRMLRETVEIVK